jgi:hypothetical protein
MVMLLSSRGSGRARSRSGFLHWVGTGLKGLFGGDSATARLTRSPSRSAVPPWLAVGVACIAFVAGYFVGGRGRTGEPDGSSLRAPGVVGQAPGVIGEMDTTPLAQEAFVIAAYPADAPSEAKAKATSLCRYLHARNLQRARPYEWPGAKGTFWTVAVYVDSPAEETATRNLLLGLPADVPDEMFVHYRDQETDWPKKRRIQ